MNLRKIKMDLTIALMNNADGFNHLGLAREVVSGYEEVGRFNGVTFTGEAELDHEHTQTNYALEFDNCTVDVQMIANRSSNTSFINGFTVR